MKERKKRSPIWFIEITSLKNIVAHSSHLNDILKFYNLESKPSNYRILKLKLDYENIDYSHIVLGLKSNKGRIFGSPPTKTPLNKVLVENSVFNKSKLKIRLLKEKLLKNKCYICSIGPEWNGQPLSLQIDHINGISNDNRIENLRILCPNCHSQTPTFAGKRFKKLNSV